jgi:hypothetical protein
MPIQYILKPAMIPSQEGKFMAAVSASDTLSFEDVFRPQFPLSFLSPDCIGRNYPIAYPKFHRLVRGIRL